MITLYKCVVLLNDTTFHPFLPFHSCSEEWLKEYMEKNPFPETSQYSGKNLFNDFMGTDIGMLYFFHLWELNMLIHLTPPSQKFLVKLDYLK